MVKSLLSLTLLLEFVAFLFIFLDKKQVIDYSLTIGDVGNILVLIITAWMVWIYTEEAQKSNEIQERPILNLYLREEVEGRVKEKILRLRNVGKGPAYNVRISSIKAKDHWYIPKFNQANFILEASKDERSVDFDVLKPNGGFELYENYSHYFELFVDRLFPRDIHDMKQKEVLKRSAAVFLINYEGVNKRAYYSIFRLYPKSWPLINVYDLLVEYVESGSGKMTIYDATRTCKNVKTLLKN